MTVIPTVDSANERSAQVWSEPGPSGLLKLHIAGYLDSRTTAIAWNEAMSALQKSPVQRVVVDASRVEYCDISGIGLFVELSRLQHKAGGELEIQGLRREFRQLLDLFDPDAFPEFPAKKHKATNIAVEVGRMAFKLWKDMAVLVAFVGELSLSMLRVVSEPRQIRWGDVARAAEKAGVNALPIVTLISFLVGLIMAFQAAIPMRQFGAEVFVADLVALSMFRELGPLMTAIVFTGRSGSAFAAELGTMKVNEEIDAINTMGLDPVRFLILPRIMASLAMTPLLSVFSGVVGVCGGSLVLLSLDYSLVTYFNEVISAVTYVDFLGGIFKSVVFGVVVAGVGCLRGLETGIGATAVGDATTRAVVSGIVLIVVIDGVFSVVYYYLGI